MASEPLQTGLAPAYPRTRADLKQLVSDAEMIGFALEALFQGIYDAIDQPDGTDHARRGLGMAGQFCDIGEREVKRLQDMLSRLELAANRVPETFA